MDKRTRNILLYVVISLACLGLGYGLGTLKANNNHLARIAAQGERAEAERTAQEAEAAAQKATAEAAKERQRQALQEEIKWWEEEEAKNKAKKQHE